MSSKKDKYLESAQKFIAKGQLDRAIRDYEQVVAMDPNDIRHRQRLAELLVRVNRTTEAIEEYEAIGKHYADHGFYLKAIAVYKQIQKLDPDDIKTCLALASLNEKQGLTGNALADYGRAFSYFEKSGKQSDALRILEMMAGIDPDNLNTRLKFAETRFSMGMKDQAYNDFKQIALHLKMQGDEGAFGQVCDRIRYLFPDKKEFTLELLSAQIKSGCASDAISHLLVMTKDDQTNLPAWRLLLEGYRATGNREDVKLALQKMVSIFPDDLGVKEGLIRYALDGGDLDGAVQLLELHSVNFIEKGEAQALESICLSALDHAPHDVRILQTLRKLYESGGNQEKIAEVEARLDSLSRLGARPEPGSKAEQAAIPDESPPTADRSGDTPYEEAGEIDLSLDEEPFDEEWDHVESVEEPEAAEAVSDADLGVSLEVDYPDEVDLELEISEDEIVPTGFNQDSGPATDTDLSIVSDVAVSTGPEFAGEEAVFSEGDLAELAMDEILGPAAGLRAEDETGVTGSVPSSDKFGPDGLSSAFRRGLDQQLEQGDTETRYNLGIAFKEMGLYDEAIAEFRAAALDPLRSVDCMTLQGICYRDKGDYGSAEEIFKKGVGLEVASEDEVLSMQYELALLYEIAGRAGDALDLFVRIQETRKGFRDTGEKIAQLQGREDVYDLDLLEMESEESD